MVGGNLTARSQRLIGGAVLVALVLAAMAIVNERVRSRAAELPPLPWTRIATVEALEAALARGDGRPALLDFYADWCPPCREMELYTFSDARVAVELARFRLLRVDVTSPSRGNLALLQRFHLFGPPGTIVFDASGRQVAPALVGFEPAERFLETLATAGGH